MRGNAPDPTPAIPETLIGAAAVPFPAISLMRTSLPFAPRSTQLATAPPEARLTISTRPNGLPSSIRTFLPNVAPASFDKTAYPCGLSSGALNRATATLFPFDETAGPLIGQPSISQPSFASISGWDHLPLTNRA